MINIFKIIKVDRMNRVQHVIFISPYSWLNMSRKFSGYFGNAESAIRVVISVEFIFTVLAVGRGIDILRY